MKEEFNLSEKALIITGSVAGREKIYYEKDVKEFIRLLKEAECDKNTCGKIGGFDCLRCETLDFMKKKIDKLAGDELI